jgi:hypothetical protein
MSIDKKNKKSFLDNISLTKYQEQESNGSISHRTNQVRASDIQTSIHQETQSPLQSLHSTPIVYRDLSVNVSIRTNSHFETDEREVITYLTDPKMYLASSMHNPCEVTEAGSPI